MVCKIDIKVFNGDKTAANETAKNRWVTQLYAVFMAKLYRQVSCEINATPLYFLPPMLYELE